MKYTGEPYFLYLILSDGSNITQDLTHSDINARLDHNLPFSTPNVIGSVIYFDPVANFFFKVSKITMIFDL